MRIILYPPSQSMCMGFTPEKMWSVGLGGAEQSVILLTTELARRGHEITIFNNTKDLGKHDGVYYFNRSNLSIYHWETPPDIFILYRAPDPNLTAFIRLHWPDTRIVAWSTDQATEGDYAQWFKDVDYIITISPFHTQYHINRYGAHPDKISHIDLPINAPDYLPYNKGSRGHTFLWSSQPQRGLEFVALAWTYIKDALPGAELYITADHRLWGVQYTGNEDYVPLFRNEPDVHFKGAIPRRELVEIQNRTAIQLSSLTYEELFGVSIMEAQAAGAIPVVGSLGALPTTVMVGECVTGNPTTREFLDRWIATVIEYATRPDLPELSRLAHGKAIARCGVLNIADQWENLLQKMIK